MVPRKLQISETFHSISKILEWHFVMTLKVLFLSFLESQIFELFAVKSQILKQGLGKFQILPFSTPKI